MKTLRVRKVHMVYQTAIRPSVIRQSRCRPHVPCARDFTPSSWSFPDPTSKMNTLTQITAFLVVVALSSSSVVQSPASGKNFELLILHNNDMHARFEQTSQLSGTCTPADRDAGKCYGGFPRVAYVVKEARKAAASGQGPPVLYLNAGDTYTGTAWFTIYKWRIAAEFVNALQPDAVSLGNHELDEGVAGLAPFIRNLTSPVLAANLILDNVPELKNETNLYKSIILQIDGTNIGIIGYLTPDTRFLAPKNKMDYEDEVIAIRREVEILKKEGVNIFIALGHSGYIKDTEIAKNVEDIDLVIGGHSNTFLWNGNFVDEKPEVPQGPYPAMITQPSGRRVPVVQAYAYTKYLGKLHLIFNSEGEIIKYDGLPLLLDHDIPTDPDLQNTINHYRKEIDRINNEVLGQSAVALNGDCRLKECNIGNLITDAVLDFTKRYYPEFSDVKIVIVQGGRIRTSIDHPERPFNVTRGDLVTVLPFSDTLSIVTMNGNLLRKVLEHSISTWRTVDSTGQFLQMAGMRVTYDLAQPVGSRVVNAQAVCSHCGEPNLADINDDYEYKVFMPTFLADGGDDFSMFQNLHKEIVSYDELKSTVDYIGRFSPVKPDISGRIVLLNKERIINAESQTRNSSNKMIESLNFLIITIVFLIIQ